MMRNHPTSSECLHFDTSSDPLPTEAGPRSIISLSVVHRSQTPDLGLQAWHLATTFQVMAHWVPSSLSSQTSPEISVDASHLWCLKLWQWLHHPVPNVRSARPTYKQTARSGEHHPPVRQIWCGTCPAVQWAAGPAFAATWPVPVYVVVKLKTSFAWSLTLSRRSALLTDKRKDDYAAVANYIRTEICFALLKSVLISLRGVRGKQRKNTNCLLPQ